MMWTAFADREMPQEYDRDVLACYAVGKDPRVYTQQSCFTIHHDRNIQLDNVDRFPEFTDVVFRIMIPAQCKLQMKHQLAMVDITSGFIYPDLEHIARDLKRGYGLQ